MSYCDSERLKTGSVKRVTIMRSLLDGLGDVRCPRLALEHREGLLIARTEEDVLRETNASTCLARSGKRGLQCGQATILLLCEQASSARALPALNRNKLLDQPIRAYLGDRKSPSHAIYPLRLFLGRRSIKRLPVICCMPSVVRAPSVDLRVLYL